MHGLAVDGVIVNRVLPYAVTDALFQEWRPRKVCIIEEIEAYFAPVAVKRVPLFAPRSAGPRAAGGTGARAVTEKEDPAAVVRTEAPYTFAKCDGHYEVRLQLPFAAKGEVELFKKGDELVVEIGTLRRHIGLPTSMAALSPFRARLENRILTVEMKEN